MSVPMGMGTAISITISIKEELNMCEANAYLRKDGQDELFLESVDKVVQQEEDLVLENIFGQKKVIKARIKEMALVDHKIILERI